MNDTADTAKLELLALAALLTAPACLPSFEDRPWRVEEARVLAVRSTPAELEPGQSVTYEALIARPEGGGDELLSWSFCTQPRRAEERGAVSSACARGEALEPTPNPALVPSDACARFGPNSPPTEGDAPPQRPADPDASGGYAIPVHASASLSADTSVEAFGKTRIRCDLVGATRPVFDEFEERYVNNQNPALEAIELEAAGTLTTLDPLGAPPLVAADEHLRLRLRTAPEAIEPYLRYELELGSLSEVEETLRVRWYFSGGELERALDIQGPGPAGEAASFETAWTAPSEPGPVRGWVVVSDDRGGTSWLAFELLVEGEVSP